MNTQASYLHKLRYFFYILMAAIFGWFLFMELFGADEQSANRTSTAALYSGTFVWEKADGTSEEIKVPGRYQVPVGETMVLTTTLPDTPPKKPDWLGRIPPADLFFALLPIRMQEKNFVWN